MKSSSSLRLLPRDNPFRTGALDRLRYIDPVNLRSPVDAIVARFLASGRRGALVGPKGTGKSTLLRALIDHPETGGVALQHYELKENESNPSLASWVFAARRWSGRTLLAIDGVEQMPRWQWRLIRSLSTRCWGVLVTSHSEGLLPTLNRHQGTANLLEALVSRLSGDRFAQLKERLPGYFLEFDGNVREILRQLYDDCA